MDAHERGISRHNGASKSPSALSRLVFCGAGKFGEHALFVLGKSAFAGLGRRTPNGPEQTEEAQPQKHRRGDPEDQRVV